MKLTWKDIIKAHVYLRRESSTFHSELEIYQREADYLNKLLKAKKRKARKNAL